MVPSIRVNVPHIWLPDGELNPGLLRDRRGSLPLDHTGLYVTHHEIPDIIVRRFRGVVGCIEGAVHYIPSEAKVILSLLSLQLCRKLWYRLVCYCATLVRKWGNISLADYCGIVVKAAACYAGGTRFKPPS